jgi:hypothetical protein
MPTADEMIAVRHRAVPVDSAMVRWRQLRDQARHIKVEMERLKEQMRTGICEVCGAAFVRRRVTRRHCSNVCVTKAHLDRLSACDIPAIRETWPLIEASGQMSDAALAVVRAVVKDGRPIPDVADIVGLSRQRVHQLLGRATKLARFLQAVKGAMREDLQ